jgi:hypothetical protein
MQFELLCNNSFQKICFVVAQLSTIMVCNISGFILVQTFDVLHDEYSCFF